MPTLSLTEDRTLVQIPQKQGKDRIVLSPVREERIRQIKVDNVVAMGRVGSILAVEGDTQSTV